MNTEQSLAFLAGLALAFVGLLAAAFGVCRAHKRADRS